VLIAVIGFVLLSGGDNGGAGGDNQNAASQPKQTEKPRKKEPTGTATPSAESTPEPTATATATATPTATPPPAGGTGLAAARRLQLQGFNARKAGDYEGALSASSAALKACGDAHQLDPCGYALFEVGADLVALGRGDEAVQYLERRLNEYGDNSSGEVQAALDEARGKKPKKAKKDKAND